MKETCSSESFSWSHVNTPCTTSFPLAMGLDKYRSWYIRNIPQKAWLPPCILRAEEAQLWTSTMQLRLSLRIILPQHLSNTKSSRCSCVCSCTCQEIASVSPVILTSTKLPGGKQRGTARLPAPSSLLLATSPWRAKFLGAFPFLKRLWMMPSCKQIQVAPEVHLIQSDHHFAEFVVFIVY